MTASAAAEDFVEGLSRFTRAVRSSAHRFDRIVLGMRRSDVMLLRWLGKNGEARLGDIADEMCLNASVISRQVTALEAAGLVTRRSDPEDGRAGLVQVSATGAERLAEARQAYADYLEKILADWDDDKVQAAADVLLEISALMTNDDASHERTA